MRAPTAAQGPGRGRTAVIGHLLRRKRVCLLASPELPREEFVPSEWDEPREGNTARKGQKWDFWTWGARDLRGGDAQCRRPAGATEPFSSPLKAKRESMQTWAGSFQLNGNLLINKQRDTFGIFSTKKKKQEKILIE